MKKFIDVHCHPYLEYFDEPLKIIDNGFASGMQAIFLVGTNLENSQEAINLSKKRNNLYPIIGIHPNDSWNETIIDQLEKMVDESVIGIGEVGLDYHYDDTPKKEIQKNCFEKQIEIAYKNNIPVIVHSRDAHDDTLEIIKKYKNKYPDLDFILHSYSSGTKYLNEYIKLGVYLSFSGIVTFKNAKDTQEAAKLVPTNLLMCETDTPYLAPTPYRGQTNLPQYVFETIKFIADLKNIEVNKLIETINNNIKKVFKKVKF